MNKKKEHRHLALSSVRAEEEGGKHVIEGYAAVFDKETVIWGLFKEILERGAFKKALETEDIRALWSHDPALVLGRTKNGTLELEEDDIGLRFELELPDTNLGNDAYASIKRGDVDGMSIGFVIEVEEWHRSPDSEGMHLRVIKEARLFEISPVAFPAYEETEVSARSATENLLKSVETGWAEEERSAQETVALKRQRLERGEIAVKRAAIRDL